MNNIRNRNSSPLSRRTKKVTEGTKIKQGGILGQDKTKRRTNGATTKDKRRFGRDVEVTRMGGSKIKTVSKGDDVKKKKVKAKLLGRGTKTYKGGGKIVAQGADKKDVRRERKQERQEKAGARAVKRGERKTRNKNYRSTKKAIRTGSLKPYVNDLSKNK